MHPNTVRQLDAQPGSRQADSGGNRGALDSAMAGAPLIGLLFAFFAVMEWKVPAIFHKTKSMVQFIPALLVFVVIGWVLVQIPLNNAGKPDEPAPPSAV